MTDDGPIRQTAEGLVLDVWVVPGAARSEIRGLHDGALRVRVAAPASAGQANRAVLALLQTRLGCRVSLRRGGRGRRKQVLIESTDLAAIAALLDTGNH